MTNLQYEATNAANYLYDGGYRSDEVAEIKEKVLDGLRDNDFEVQTDFSEFSKQKLETQEEINDYVDETTNYIVARLKEIEEEKEADDEE
jgi:hypothetical protein